MVIAAVGLWLWAFPIPAVGECGYLLGAFRAGHPGFLASDFTFGTQAPKTIVFDLLIGALTRIAPMETIALGGRVVTLVVVAFALIRIGQRVGLTAGWAAAAVIAWLAFGQSIVGGERATMILVPKTLSWAAGLVAFDLVLARRAVGAGIALGLAVAIQQSVGAGLGLAIAAAMLALRYDWRGWAAVVGVSLLIAAPAAIATVNHLQQPGTDLIAEWRYQALVRAPVHLDVRHFSKRSLAAVVGMIGFILLIGRRSDHPAVKALGWVTVAMVGLFSFGLIATWSGRYDLLVVFPFRVPPVVIQSSFFILLLTAFRAGWLAPPARLLPLGVLAILLAMPDPYNMATRRLRRTDEPRDDLAALQWIRAHTRPDAVLVVSPALPCTQYLTHRAQIVYGDLARLDRLREWRERFQAHFPPGTPERGGLDPAFNRLDEAGVRSLVAKYGGDYLVSRGVYSFPVAFPGGAYQVYDLSALPRPLPR